jgi:hypothetical protein
MAQLFVRRPKAYFHVIAIILLALLTFGVTLLAGHKSAARRTTDSWSTVSLSATA